MNNEIYTKDEKDLIKNKFLLIPDKYIKYIKNPNAIWLYTIKDTKTDSIVYIGKAKDINIRAMQYISEYIRGGSSRKINATILKNGISRYQMEVSNVVLTEEEGSIEELRLIDKFSTIDNGCNVIYQSKYTNRSGSGNKSSTKHTSAAKRSKSKLICMISPVDHKIFICTGLKLGGDIIGKSKDVVKNYARRGLCLNGFFIYYLNYVDFHMICDKVKSKYITNKSFTRATDILTYDRYLKYAKYVESYVKSKGHKNPENFDCKFVTQDDNSESGILYTNPDHFLKDYELYSFKIYN